MILQCPTTGEFCNFVALTEEDRAMQSDMFERCASSESSKTCGHYVLMAESIKSDHLQEGAK